MSSIIAHKCNHNQLGPIKCHHGDINDSDKKTLDIAACGFNGFGHGLFCEVTNVDKSKNFGLLSE